MRFNLHRWIKNMFCLELMRIHDQSSSTALQAPLPSKLTKTRTLSNVISATFLKSIITKGVLHYVRLVAGSSSVPLETTMGPLPSHNTETSCDISYIWLSNSFATNFMSWETARIALTLTMLFCRPLPHFIAVLYFMINYNNYTLLWYHSPNLLYFLYS